jgi:predicted Zn finger-like uncharacterized protein
MIVSCECGAKLKIDESRFAGKRVKIRCPRCGNILPLAGTAAPAPAPVAETSAPAVLKPADPSSTLILVAHDSDVIRKMVSDVLVDGGYRVETSADGVDALRKATDLKPRGMVVDVGLPGIYGFELCERMKNSTATKEIKIVLLSSVYDSRRYKRTPASLYGADDYIEKHHIPDSLVRKFRNLFEPVAVESTPKQKDHEHVDLPEMSRPPAREFAPSILSHDLPPAPAERETPAPSTSQPAASMRQAEPAEATAVMPESFSLEASIFQKEECDIPRVEDNDPDAVEKARRFARIIVSDVALYNQETVIEGIRHGTFFELLANDVAEGRDLYEKRVPAAVRAQKDYYQEAFDNFLAAAKRKKM